MSMYITQDTEGNITSYADWMFPNSFAVDYTVVYGYDGKLYKEGTEPVKPEATFDEKVSQINAKYSPRMDALKNAMVSAQLLGGDIVEETIESLRIEWLTLTNEKELEILALLENI